MIFILVPVHDRIKATLSFIDSINKQTFKDFKIIIVDDGSTDDTSKIVQNKYPEIKIIKGDGNLWWTGSVAKGMEYIRRVSKLDDFILCANNDTTFEPNAIEKLLVASIRHKRAICASIIKNSEGEVVDSAYTINWKNYEFTRIPDGSNGDYIKQIDVLPCRSTLIPREVFEKVKFDYKNFPHYLGDYDFFLHCQRAGFKMILSYDSIAYDVGGKSGIEKTDEKITLKEFYNNLFDIRSHQNIFHTTKFIFINCSNIFYKVFLILILWLKYLLQGIKILFTEIF